MGSICRPSDLTGSRDPDPRVFIKCVNCKDPMANELWYHGLYGLSSDSHPTAQVEITPANDGEFITDYLTTDGRRIRIIGQYSVNGSVQFTDFPEVWGIILLYMSNATILDANKVRG